MRPLVDIESRHNANRSRVFAWTAVALLPLAFVAGLSLSDAEAAPKTKTPKLHFIECAPGGVHAWVSEDGGVAVLPAGSDCP